MNAALVAEAAHEPVFVFPGQGSQHPGMGRDLAVCGAASRDLVGMAEHVSGLPVGDLMTRADARTIADPEIAQLLVFVWSSVMYRHLGESGYQPAAVAGHSLGEYTALVACGSLDWEPAVALVAARGRAMAEAAAHTPGTMAALVGLDAGTVAQLCRQASADGRVAVVANLNSPRQVVVSGSAGAVTHIVEQARARGALRAKQLPVGGAYHSPLMEAAEARLAEHLLQAPLRPPHTPFVSSVTGRWVEDIAAYRAELLRQVTSPVRWREAVGTLADWGARTYVEVGPGRVLTGLNREIARSARHLTALEALRAPAAAALRIAKGSGRR